jgi:hypothetical protein
MASTHKSLRSGTANKRPTTSIAEGQIALNTNSASPGLFFKDSTGATVIKIGPVHVGTTAPNVAPASGGSSGNSTGEVWLDTSLTPAGVKIWNGSAWVNATPSGSTTIQGLLELATDAETQTGSDTARAVTPASLQSKVSDSTSTTSSTTIASSTAVKAAYDLAAAAVPLSGGTVTGNLEIGTAGSLSFEGTTANGFETTLAVVDPTADRTITLPNVSGNIVTTGDTGTVTSTMLANDTVVDADINAAAAISLSKLATGALPSAITVASANIVDDTIVNADVNASAAIAGTKISPDFGSQNRTSTGTSTAASFIPTSSTVPSNGVYLPAANSVAISSNGTGRLFVDASGAVGVGQASDNSAYRLNVYNPSADVCAVSIGNNVSGGGALNGLVIAQNQADASFINRENGYTAFSTNNTERMRIDSSGKLLVGTSTNISDAGIQSAAVTGDASSISTARFGASTNGGYFSIYRSRGATVGAHGTLLANDTVGALYFWASDGASYLRAVDITAAIDGTPGTNDMPCRLVFSTTADGASSPTEALRITSDKYLRMAASTGGIQFNGDTAAANALNDYEEGTWTPSIGGTATYTVQAGRYTKIGRVVYAAFYLTISTIGTGSTWQITGLPFTALSGVQGGGSVNYWASLNGSFVYITPYVIGSTTISLYALTAAGASLSGAASIFKNTATVQGFVAYKV